MPVVVLPPAGEDHGGGEEGDTVDVGEEDGQAGVQAEQLHRAEVGDGSDTEGCKGRGIVVRICCMLGEHVHGKHCKDGLL